MKNLLIQLFFALWIGLSFQSAAANEIDVEKLKGKPVGNGIALFSLSVSGVQMVNYASLQVLRASDKSPVHSLTVGRPFFGINEHFSGSDGRWGRLVALQLPPGEYLFGEVSMNLVFGSRGELLTTPGLSRTFIVEADKIIYTGNLDLLPESNREITAGSVVFALLTGAGAFASTGYAHVRDLFDRDIKVLLDKNPTFDAGLIERKVQILPSDEEYTNLYKTYAQAAASGDGAAKAALAMADTVGYVRLRNGSILRGASKLNFNNERYANFEGTAPAHIASTLLNWSNAISDQAWVRKPLQLSAERKAALYKHAMQNYSIAAIDAWIRTRSSDSHLTDHVKNTWETRRRNVVALGSVQDNLSRHVGEEVADKVFGSKAKGVALAISRDGKSYIAEAQPNQSTVDMFKAALTSCERESRDSCEQYIHPRGGYLPICHVEDIGGGWTTQFPPVELPDASVSGTQAWNAGFKAWEEANRFAKMSPRSVVWDEQLGKTFHSAGSCLAALRALSQCRSAGGKACKLVVQDDKVVEGTDYAKATQERLEKYWQQPR